MKVEIYHWNVFGDPDVYSFKVKMNGIITPTITRPKLYFSKELKLYKTNIRNKWMVSNILKNYVPKIKIGKSEYIDHETIKNFRVSSPPFARVHSHHV